MMLTKIQKEILISIKQNNFYDLNWFYHNYCDRQPSTSSVNWREFKYGDEIKVPKNNDIFLKKVAEFISLWEFLKKENLIFEIERSQHPEKTSLVLKRNDDETGGTWDYFQFVTKDHRDKSFLPLSDLEDFKNQDYKTQHQYDLEQERIDRKQAQKFTKNVSITAIIISGLSLIFTLIFGIISFSSNTKVEIVKNDAPQDSINVNINKLPDSSKVYIENLLNRQKSMPDKTIKTNKNQKTTNKKTTNNNE